MKDVHFSLGKEKQTFVLPAQIPAFQLPPQSWHFLLLILQFPSQHLHWQLKKKKKENQKFNFFSFDEQKINENSGSNQKNKSNHRSAE